MPSYAKMDNSPFSAFPSFIGTITAATADLESFYPEVASSCQRIGGINGSREKNIVYDLESDKWVRSEASK